MEEEKEEDVLVEKKRKRKTIIVGVNTVLLAVITTTRTTTTRTTTSAADRPAGTIDEDEDVPLLRIFLLATTREEDGADPRGSKEEDEEEEAKRKRTRTRTEEDQRLAFPRRWRSFTKPNSRTIRTRAADEVLIDQEGERRKRQTVLIIKCRKDDNTGEISRGTRKID